MKKIRFALEAEAGKTVSVAGTFNGWDPEASPMPWDPVSGLYAAWVDVPSGRHEYKLVMDGVWCIDPNCEDWAPNGLGSLNSVVTVS